MPLKNNLNKRNIQYLNIIDKTHTMINFYIIETNFTNRRERMHRDTSSLQKRPGMQKHYWFGILLLYIDALLFVFCKEVYCKKQPHSFI